MTWEEQHRYRHLNRLLDGRPISEIRIREQQVNPIQGKQADNETAEELPITPAQPNNAQRQGAQNNDLESVDVE